MTLRGGHRVIRPTNRNLCLIFEHYYAGSYRLNEMGPRYQWRHDPTGTAWQDWADEHIARVRYELDDHWGLKFSTQSVREAAIYAFAKVRVHPVRTWLDSLVWDGVERLNTIWQNTFGLFGNALYDSFLRKTLIGAVRRVYQPGCKHDTVLTLAGKGGIGKSTFISELCHDRSWFSDDPMTDIENKDAKLQLHYVWLYEWGEVEKITSKRNDASIKSFLSQQSDKFRKPYAASTEEVPRSMIFIGTTNDERFLTDPTGNRRWFVVTLPANQLNLEWLRAHRDQLWAEAVVAHRADEPSWLAPDEMEQQAALLADAHMEEDSWFEAISEWLVSADGWPSLRWNDRSTAPSALRSYGDAPDTPTVTTLAHPRPLKTDLIFTFVIQKPLKDRHQGDTRKVISVMRRLGWEQKTTIDKNRQGPDGRPARVRAWVKSDGSEPPLPSEKLAAVQRDENSYLYPFSEEVIYDSVEF
jgi:hypothetical protein